MNAIKFIKENNIILPFELSEALGNGANGECFASKADARKAIKLSVIYDDPGNEYDTVISVLDHLIANHYSTYMRVYERGFLGNYSRTYFNNRSQNYIIYYYIIERLSHISEDEKKVFLSVFKWKYSKKSVGKVKKMLDELSRGLDFDASKVIFFYENFGRVPISHNDLHDGNVMKDNDGNFKLIDFDLCTLL